MSDLSDPNRRWRADQLLARLDSRRAWLTLAITRHELIHLCTELFGVQHPIIGAALGVVMAQELEEAGVALRLTEDDLLLERVRLATWATAQRP